MTVTICRLGVIDVVDTLEVELLPLAPRNPLPYRQQLRAIKNSHTGCETIRDAGGPVTKVRLGPRIVVPAIVVVTSPQGARDILGRNHEFVDRGTLPFMVDLRHLIGGNLANLPYAEWLPRKRALQPVFTKQHVPQFAGHMAGSRRPRSPELARRRCRRSQCRLSHADAAGSGSVSIGPRPRRQRRCDGQRYALRDEMGRRSLHGAGARATMASHAGSGAPARRTALYTGSPSRSCRRAVPIPTGTHR